MNRYTKFRGAALPIAFTVAAIVGLMSIGAQAHAAEVSGSVAVTTDYVWRGVTQSDSDPAVQGSLKLAGENGLYASVWGSNVDFGPAIAASSEFDITLGYGRAINDDWAFDVNVLHYAYPGTTVDLDWTELNGTLTWRGNYYVTAGWSPEALGSDEQGTYVQAGARFPVNDAFRFEAALGHYALDDVYDESYSHASLGAVWMVKKPLELRVTAHGTDGNAEDLFGRDFAGNRIEAALQASF
jgi:uncharacterized protein (TIGR02001 family)